MRRSSNNRQRLSGLVGAEILVVVMLQIIVSHVEGDDTAKFMEAMCRTIEGEEIIMQQVPGTAIGVKGFGGVPKRIEEGKWKEKEEYKGKRLLLYKKLIEAALTQVPANVNESVSYSDVEGGKGIVVMMSRLAVVRELEVVSSTTGKHLVVVHRQKHTCSGLSAAHVESVFTALLQNEVLHEFIQLIANGPCVIVPLVLADDQSFNSKFVNLNFRSIFTPKVQHDAIKLNLNW